MSAIAIGASAVALITLSWAVLIPYPGFRRFSNLLMNCLKEFWAAYLSISERLIFSESSPFKRVEIRSFFIGIIGRDGVSAV